MNIFVTGGSGFLGKRLITRLTQSHHRVTALSRSAQTDALLRELGAETVSGSLNNIDEWAAALEGQDVVIHAASPIDVWGEWDHLYREITQATAMLYQACGTRNVKRFIYISSESVLQDRKPLVDIDETFPYPDEPNSYYGKAKKLAELALLHTQSPTEAIILRPPFIWGHGDKQLDTIINKIASRQFIWVDHGQAVMEMVHVENLVEAIRLALTNGKSKNVYFVSDDHPMTAKAFLTALLQTRGITPPQTSVSSVLAKPLARLTESLWRGLRIKSAPPLSRFQLDFIALPRRYRVDKIKHELGYRPVYSFETGVEEMNSTA
jgi:nucleoside-diphosphate-sugar epimerase